jgi:hypothetical protein
MEFIVDHIDVPSLDAHHMDPEYITVHTTRNLKKGANAHMHSRFLKFTADVTQKRWHETIDDKACIQHLKHTINAWAAGDGLYGTGNRKSIQIEICENVDGDFEKAKTNAIFRIKQIMKEHNIPIERVVPHRTWSGKDCPHVLLKDWASFIERIKENVTVVAASELPKVISFSSYPRFIKVVRDTGGYNYANLADRTKTYAVGTVMKVYGETYAAWAGGGGVFIQKKDTVELPQTIITGGLTKVNVDKVEEFFKSKHLDGSIEFIGEGNPYAKFTLKGNLLQLVCEWLESNGWWYKVK